MQNPKSVPSGGERSMCLGSNSALSALCNARHVFVPTLAQAEYHQSDRRGRRMTLPLGRVVALPACQP
eukprot:4433849-Pyramimonas_sp.AAC.2